MKRTTQHPPSGEPVRRWTTIDVSAVIHGGRADFISYAEERADAAWHALHCATLRHMVCREAFDRHRGRRGSMRACRRYLQAAEAEDVLLKKYHAAEANARGARRLHDLSW